MKLPFWDSGIWAGYFTAYDRTILGKRNGNPGVMKKAIPKEQLNAMTSRFVTDCYNVPYTSCVSVGDECYNDYTGEWESCGGSTQTYCSTSYNYECFTYWVDDEPTDPTDPTDPNAPPPCPDGYEMDANGNCIPINQCDNIDLSSALYNQVDSIEFIGSTFTSKKSNTTAKSMDSNTTSKLLSWRLKVGPETYVKSTEEGVLKSVNNPSHPYEWQSLTHKSLDVDSSVMIVDITVESHNGVATLGLYNSIMDLSFHLKASLVCNGMPFADHKNYTGQRIFTIANFGQN